MSKQYLPNICTSVPLPDAALNLATDLRTCEEEDPSLVLEGPLGPPFSTRLLLSATLSLGGDAASRGGDEVGKGGGEGVTTRDDGELGLASGVDD